MASLTHRWFRISVGFLLFSSGMVSAQWIAFNDHAPGTGTHVNATRYNVFHNTYPQNGQLRDIRSGTNLAVTLTVAPGTSGVTANDGWANPAPGTPAFNAFYGFVDFGGTPSPSIEVSSNGRWSTSSSISTRPSAIAFMAAQS